MDREQYKNDSTATLIYWSSPADKARIERWLKKLQEEGHIDRAVTNDYCSSISGPVWYIP